MKKLLVPERFRPLQYRYTISDGEAVVLGTLVEQDFATAKELIAALRAAGSNASQPANALGVTLHRLRKQLKRKLPGATITTRTIGGADVNPVHVWELNLTARLRLRGDVFEPAPTP